MRKKIQPIEAETGTLPHFILTFMFSLKVMFYPNSSGAIKGKCLFMSQEWFLETLFQPPALEINNFHSLSNSNMLRKDV